MIPQTLNPTLSTIRIKISVLHLLFLLPTWMCRPLVTTFPSFSQVMLAGDELSPDTHWKKTASPSLTDWSWGLKNTSSKPVKHNKDNQMSSLLQTYVCYIRKCCYWSLHTELQMRWWKHVHSIGVTITRKPPLQHVCAKLQKLQSHTWTRWLTQLGWDCQTGQEY